MDDFGLIGYVKMTWELIGYVKMTWELLNLQNAISSYIYKINLFSNNEMDDFGMIFSFAFSKKEIKK